MATSRFDFNPYMFSGGANQFFGGLFGDSGAPYEAANNEYNAAYNRGKEIQNPFYNNGVNAIPQFQQWLNGMKDPSAFINHLMGQYQESPFAKYQQDQATRAARNLGSASGLTGSTPLTQFAEQNARDISSQDLNSWLQNVLGINTQYGAGVNSQITGGQNAANALTNMNTEFGKAMAEAKYGQKAGENQDTSNIWGGIFNALGSFFI